MVSRCLVQAMVCWVYCGVHWYLICAVLCPLSYGFLGVYYKLWCAGCTVSFLHGCAAHGVVFLQMYQVIGS